MKRVLAVLLIASLALSQNPIRSGGGAGGGGSSYFAGTGLILSSFTFSVNTAIIASIDDYQDGRFDSAVCTGTNAYTCNPAQAFTGALVTGSPFRAQFTNASTGAVTLNVSALGAKKAYRIDRTTQLGSGDLAANSWHSFVYDTAADSGSGGWIQQSGGSGGGGGGAPAPGFDVFASRGTCNSANTGKLFYADEVSYPMYWVCDGSAWQQIVNGRRVTPPTVACSGVTMTRSGTCSEGIGTLRITTALSGITAALVALPTGDWTKYFTLSCQPADFGNPLGCGISLTDTTTTLRVGLERSDSSWIITSRLCLFDFTGCGAGPLADRYGLTLGLDRVVLRVVRSSGVLTISYNTGTQWVTYGNIDVSQWWGTITHWGPAVWSTTASTTSTATVYEWNN